MISLALLLGRLLLALVFGVASITKLADQAGSRKSMGEFGVPALLAPLFSLLLPLVELACAVALVVQRSVRWGASGALVLLWVFIAAIAVSLARGRRPDCHCFGQLQSSPVGWTTLSRNVILAALAGLVAWQGPAAGVASVMSVFDPTVTILSVVAFQAVFGLLGLYQLLGQNGRILQRLEALEARLGVNAAPPESEAAGLPIGSVAPTFSLLSLEGETVTLAGVGQLGKPILLFFSEPDCGACDGMLSDVANWQRDYADVLTVIPISRGDVQTNRVKCDTHRLKYMVLQKDREVAEKYLVTGTPSAVLVSDGQIASPLAVGAHAIRELVKSATAPPPLKKGDRVPSMQLRDLGGGTLDLATLQGQRTLLLFWNPTCGFCERMLDDVKAWESSRSTDAPELLVISGGSPKVNRDQGFRSRVLLDPNFSASQMFGSVGTPSAIIIDEEGMLASDLSVGAPEVLSLAVVRPDLIKPAVVSGSALLNRS